MGEGDNNRREWEKKYISVVFIMAEDKKIIISITI